MANFKPFALLCATMLAGCQAAAPALPTVPAVAAIAANADASTVIDALLAKNNSTWQDAAMSLPSLAARRAEKYRLQSTSSATKWSTTLPSISTSAPAFMHSSETYTGPQPLPGETAYVATEAAAGSPQIYRLDASTGAIKSAWDVLSGLSNPGIFTHTAMSISGDNGRLYLLTSGGYFVMVDAHTGNRLFAQHLSNSGFAGSAVFIDYSNGGGWPHIGANEYVYAVSNDGSVYQIHVVNGTPSVLAWPAAFGSDRSLWSGRPTIPYAGAVNMHAMPVTWRGKTYIGDADGSCYRIDVGSGTPVLTTWYPGHMSGARNCAITAPVAVDFDAGLNVNAIFVPCGDRLAWITPSYTPAEDATIVSPPLLIPKETPLQGALSSYPYTNGVVKGPYDCLDFASIAKNASPNPSAWGDGTGVDGTLFGADGYTSPTDGDDIRGYLQFELPIGDFGGGVPISARVDLSAVTTPVANENLSLYRASNYQGATNTYWTGFNYSPDIDYFNRPDLLSGVIGGYQGPVSASDATTGLPRFSLNFADPMPADADNMGGDCWQSYAMTSVGKQRANPPAAPTSSIAGEYFRGVLGDNATEPKLYVTVDDAALSPTTNGLACQASLDSISKKIWVTGSNAIFELSYADAMAFQTKTHVLYDLTAAGRGTNGAGGPTNAGSYVLPSGSVLYTGNRVITADQDPVNKRFFVNEFSAPLSSNADSLTTATDIGAGSGPVGGMVFDYLAGSVYLTTADKRVMRVAIQ
ncbi:MAG TPA: PQQ-binding-like beta-propeller repeat protein [Oscillatoriaceae cyanobacterium]